MGYCSEVVVMIPNNKVEEAKDILDVWDEEYSDKEATYLVSQFLISASYDNFTGNMFIYLNGNKVASKIHSGKNSTFNIAPNDTFIGIATEDYSANTRKQFMGELHELAIISGVNNGSLSLDTLTPNYRNILMYFRFEESDL